jgi:enterochelin esterase-like enzyme
LYEFPSKILGRTHYLRACLPAGYNENTLASYPVAFNARRTESFFSDEAFMGNTWNVYDTIWQLHSMSAAEDFVIIGIRSGDRMQEYTSPGYEAYARSLAEEVVPKRNGCYVLLITGVSDLSGVLHWVV